MLNRGPADVSSTATLASIPNAAITRFRKSTMAVVFITSVVLARRVGLAGSDAPHPPRRRARATAAGGRGARATAAGGRSELRRSDHVVGQVLLADGPDVIDEPVELDDRRVPQEQ